MPAQTDYQLEVKINRLKYEIDPETAFVFSCDRRVLEYAGVTELKNDEEYFAYSPGSPIAISFGDLPETAQKKLWQKVKASEQRGRSGPLAIDLPVDAWLAIRKAEALHIDAATAEVSFVYGAVGDPYGVLPPDEHDVVGRQYFARSPESDVWVSFDDLTEATCEELQERHKAALSFMKTVLINGRLFPLPPGA